VIRVLVVDDSVAVRGLVSTLLAEDPEIQVAGVAANGRVALQKYAQLRPDVVTLDVEMPEMDGLETLRALRKDDPSAKVIMFSSLTHRGAMTTFDALSAGAVDYVAKPEGGTAEQMAETLRADLIVKVKAHAIANRSEPRRTPPRLAKPARSKPVEIVTLASSTGGPNALSAVLGSLPADLQVPVMVVQHMPELFTKLLADRLDASAKLRVREAEAGEILEPGTVYIAPGGHHMETIRERGHVRVRLHDGPAENSCRPAADVLFRSVATVFGGGSLGVVLTGMGQDGLLGSEAIHRCGGQILAQDEASSVVWGMPRAVVEAGLAHAVMPLHCLSDEITRRVRSNG
jgi:two-component system, chemotaxis family, protein-glutamate methylesterase/glutaminase